MPKKLNYRIPLSPRRQGTDSTSSERGSNECYEADNPQGGPCQGVLWASDLAKGQLALGVISMGKYDRSFLDEDFRRAVLALLERAEEEAVVITGEFSTLGYFQDLKAAVRDAIERGVRFRVYLTEENWGVLNRLLGWGCEVYLGEEPSKTHFLVIDNRNWMSSKEHPRKRIGVRSGEYRTGDPETALKLVARFEELIRTARRLEKPDWTKDPLAEFIGSPVDIGVETDSSRIDEELQ